jgi:exosortase/archaeosortase family protein
MMLRLNIQNNFRKIKIVGIFMKSIKKEKKNFLQIIKEKAKDFELSARKNQKKQFVYFVMAFILFYIILTAIVYAFPKGFFEGVVGIIVNFILNVGGLSTQTLWGEQYDIYLLDTGKTIIISWLCTGVLEIIILVSAILASFGVSWRKRVYGIIAAVVAGIVFNLLRIIITIIIILSQSAATFELAHDLLFRITLFVYITAFYVLWFYWAEKKK